MTKAAHITLMLISLDIDGIAVCNFVSNIRTLYWVARLLTHHHSLHWHLFWLQVSLLEELRDIAKESNLGAGLQVKLRFNINEALFDYNPVVSSCMRPESWTSWVNSVHAYCVLYNIAHSWFRYSRCRGDSDHCLSVVMTRNMMYLHGLNL